MAPSLNRTAIVTGGGGGIGAIIAASLAGAGYAVAVLDRDLENARRVAAGLDGARAFFVDVTDEQSVRDAVSEVGTPPDLLVNAAGIVIRGPVIERPLADFRRVIDVNLMGAVTTTYVVAPHMLARGGGVIINISSIVGAVVAGPNTGGYAASKAAMAAFGAQMAMELRPHIRVNTIAPGMIDAGIGASSSYADEASLKAGIEAQPAGRLGTPEEIASTALFLASEGASFINGQLIVVDGGLSTSVLTQITAKRR